MTKWEYAKLDYRATGDFGADRRMDWRASFYSARGKEAWGTDENHNDILHLNRAGAAGWEAYERQAQYFHGEPHRLQAVTYSFKRELK